MRLNFTKGKTIARLVVIGCLCAFAFGTVFYGRAANAGIGVSPESAPGPTRQRAGQQPATAGPRKYSDFPHSVAAHQMECSKCHKFPSDNWKNVRATADAFEDITDYPKHESCVGCHKAQFFNGRPPVVCSICHTNPGPRNSNRHPFPNPREIFDKSPKGQRAPESDFAISFPHDKHIEMVTGDPDPTYKSAKGEESCTACHRTYQPAGSSPDEYVTKPPADLGDAFWLKKGTFKTTPIGHSLCFTCHTADSGITPTPLNCNTCHKLRTPNPPADFDPKIATKMATGDRIMLLAWRHRDSSGAFRHEFSVHSDLECSTCHTVAKMNTLDAITKKVQIASCAMCHASATLADGGALNYEADKRQKDAKFECVKCHIAFGKSAIPTSHIEALKEATGK